MDRGFAAPALRLAQLYRQGDFVEQDLEKSLYYASLAAYQSDESLKGRECQELFLQYCKKCPRFCETSSQDYDLATYWSGKAAEIDPNLIPGFVSMLATYNSEKWWYKHTSNTVFPGYTTLPLMKRLEQQVGVTDSHEFVTTWAGKCANHNCRRKDGDLKMCLGQ